MRLRPPVLIRATNAVKLMSFDLTARVADGRVAQRSELQMRVLFSDSGRNLTLDARTNVSQPQPGSVPAQRTLRELMAAAC